MNLFSLRELGRRLVPKPAHAFVRRRIHHAGLFTWDTKEYEVWLVMQYLLYLLQPRKLIEFGSGRSTDYLAEYAHKSGAGFISIEESARFARKINRGLALLMTKSDVVRHVPLRGAWYDHAVVGRILADFGPADFVLIDGPSEHGGTSRAGIDQHVATLIDVPNIKLVVLDDTHRSDNAEMADDIARRYSLLRFDLHEIRRAEHRLSFLLPPSATQVITELGPSLAARLEPISSSAGEGAGTSPAPAAT